MLKVSVCGIYEYATDKFSAYTEADIHKLVELLQNADQVIGFNIRDFDLEVLRPYCNFEVLDLPMLDIIDDVSGHLGHRIGLNAIAQATLGHGKSANGKEALLYWKNNRMDLLKKYCLDDVRITRDIYEYGLKNQKILYKDFFDIKEIPVAWVEPQPKMAVQKQVALF